MPLSSNKLPLRMGSTFNPQPKETQPLADTSNEQDTALVTASADPLSVC